MKQKHDVKSVANNSLTLKEQLRYSTLKSYVDNKISREEALSRLKVGARQFGRIVKSFKTKGIKSVIHGLVGKLSNHRGHPNIRELAIDLYVKHYNGYSYTFAAEKLLEYHNIVVPHPTLRNWLLEAKITKPLHKRKSYYKKREPRGKFGAMVQIDGSFHDWFSDGKMYCLMHFVDDATKTSLAMLFHDEGTVSALTVLKKWCELYGIPNELYMDKFSTYKVNDKNQQLSIEEQLLGQETPLTNFGKICNKLRIRLVFANTPQAKGRVERRHALFQDRFVKELKLKKIVTIEAANQFLLCNGGFLDQINSQFTVQAKELGNACLKIAKTILDRLFTIDTTRTLRNDYTLQFENTVYQLKNHFRVKPKAKITVKTDLNGTVSLYLNEMKLEYMIVTNYIKPVIEPVRPPLSTYQTTRSSRSKISKHKSPWSRTNPSYFR